MTQDVAWPLAKPAPNSVMKLSMDHPQPHLASVLYILFCEEMRASTPQACCHVL
jgi:hypothetical protein